MNQEKIGKFIALRRNKKNLTQQDLATKLGVTNKAVSKWENGKCLPDVSLFQSLCKELNISLNELLSGEMKNDKDKPIIEYLSFIKKNNKVKMILCICGMLLIIIITLLGCFFVNNYNKILVYELSGESENFYYNNGLFMHSNQNNIIIQGTVGIKNNSSIKEKDIINISLVSNDKIIIQNSSLENGDINVEPIGYNDIIDKNKIKNIDNWILSITYYENNKQVQENLPIKHSILFKSNNFFKKEVFPISTSTINRKLEWSIEEKNTILDYLTKLKFIKNEYNGFYIKQLNAEEIIGLNSRYDTIYYLKNDFIITYHIFLDIIILNGPIENREYHDLLIESKEGNYCWYYNVSNNLQECVKGDCPNDSLVKIRDFLKLYDDLFIGFN